MRLPECSKQRKSDCLDKAGTDGHTPRGGYTSSIIITNARQVTTQFMVVNNLKTALNSRRIFDADSSLIPSCWQLYVMLVVQNICIPNVSMLAVFSDVNCLFSYAYKLNKYIHSFH